MKGTWQTTDSGGGAAVAIAVLVIVVIIGSAVASTAARAVDVVLHVVEIVVIVVACTVGAAVLAGLGWAGWRLRQRMLARAAAPREPVVLRATVRPGAPPVLAHGEPPALEPVRMIPDEADQIWRTTRPLAAARRPAPCPHPRKRHGR